MKRNWKAAIAVMTFLFYMTLPVVYWNWLVFELKSGSFPVHADSIGIPMAGFLVVWFIGFLIFPVLLIAANKLMESIRIAR